MSKYWLSAIIILLNVMAVWADERQIVVVGLFEGNAVIQVDGHQYLLKEGKTTPEGIKLISANSREAIIEMDGETRRYELGNQVATDYGPPPEQAEVSVWSTNGMYLTSGTVNGYSINFLVDTGATSVALNQATADRLGLDYKNGEQISVKTASGVDVAYRVMLDYVQLGEIKLHHIDAVVLQGAEPAIALLGMSFLGQLEIKQTDNRIDLKQKY